MPKQFTNPKTGDVVTVPDALVKKYEKDPRWEPVKASGNKKSD